ncbi:MAG: prepilin-type N-terminal cleavage/methylation domain-containing protein [Campylobacterales bacterium]|nr:prepilin-type N-terminal cleavage/methylation domain-containing protein [Campylobacterales bacterium]
MRKAFTLLELIIAIVIIGIASAGLPMILSSANKLEEHTINQDIIFKSTAIMNDITSRFWDSNMYYNTEGAMIVTVNSGDADLNNSRVGFFERTENGRAFYSTAVNAGDINNTGMTLNSTDTPLGIDWYNGRVVNETASDARVRYDIRIGYVSDAPNAANGTVGTTQNFTWNLTDNGTTDASESTNLKKITITATRTMGSGEIYTNTFSYFASNIGSQELKTK